VPANTLYPLPTVTTPRGDDLWSRGRAGMDGRRPRKVGPGEVLCIRRGAVHRFDNTSAADATMLAVVTPGVLSSDYFRQLAALVGAAAGGPPDMIALADVMRTARPDTRAVAMCGRGQRHPTAIASTARDPAAPEHSSISWCDTSFRQQSRRISRSNLSHNPVPVIHRSRAEWAPKTGQGLRLIAPSRRTAWRRDLLLTASATRAS
jgi:hypothetical protein